jgi:hypothetical protein
MCRLLQVQSGSGDSVPSQQQSVFINHACSVASANNENTKNAVNQNACKRQIKSIVSKSRIPKLHVSRGPNTLNLIDIELCDNLSWGIRPSPLQAPSYCVPLIRRSSGDQSMVYLYSPQSRQSHSVHDEHGIIIPTLLFQTQNKSKKHVRFVD